MSALAVAHPGVAQSRRPRPSRLRPVPDEPVTVTISIGGGAAAGRERVLAVLRELIDLAGPAVEVSVDAASAPAPIVAGRIRLDARARTVQRDGRTLELSRLEFDLLHFLARHPRQVFSRSQLLLQVWGHTHTTNRTVDVHVSRLRTKLAEPEVVTTVYGLGYRLADDAAVIVEP